MAILNTSKVREVLKRYFGTLTSTGYVSNGSTRRILAYMFLNEMLNSELSFYLTEKDYNYIARVVRMVAGDCLIPYDNYCNNKLRQGLYGAHIGSPMLFDTAIYSRMRHTEEDVRRHAESTEVRMAQGVR